MNKNIKLIIVLIVLISIFILLRSWIGSRPIPTDLPSTDVDITVDSGSDSIVIYTNTAHGISFEYPSSLHLTENDLGATSSPQFSIVLVEDSVLQDINSGVNIPHEGLITITIEVYGNLQSLSANDFAVAHTSGTLAQGFLGATSTVMVGNNEGISYDWSGLYEGRSVVITKGTKAYVFSVTWMSPEDQLVKDFEMILDTAMVI